MSNSHFISFFFFHLILLSSLFLPFYSHVLILIFIFSHFCSHFIHILFIHCIFQCPIFSCLHFLIYCVIYHFCINILSIYYSCVLDSQTSKAQKAKLKVKKTENHVLIFILICILFIF